jgi:hypothetical protein
MYNFTWKNVSLILIVPLILICYVWSIALNHAFEFSICCTLSIETSKDKTYFTAPLFRILF